MEEKKEVVEPIILEYLEKYTYAAKRLLDEGIILHGDVFFTKLDVWFEELDLGIKGVRNEKLVKESVLEGLSYPGFQRLSKQEKLEQYLTLENSKFTQQEVLAFISGCQFTFRFIAECMR